MCIRKEEPWDTYLSRRHHIVRSNSFAPAARDSGIANVISNGKRGTNAGATWPPPFHKFLTKDGKFHRLDGTAVDAQFMRCTSDQLIAKHDGFKLLVMPYAAAATAVPSPSSPPPPRYAMCVLLPDARDGLPSLVDKMMTSSSSGPNFLQDHMPERRVEVGDFRVPKFRLSFYAPMKQQLQSLGIEAVFDRDRADLTDMMVLHHSSPAPPPRLFLDDVFHRAVIEVNEEGTEAAASTAHVFGIATMAAPRHRVEAVDFVADHPFAFFVVEEGSGAILFAGQVLDPTKP